MWRRTLGLALFERTNRGLEPTAYGEIFARHAKIVLAQLRHAAEELESLRVGYSGKVTVGTLLAASASILPDAIALLKKERPEVAISVVVGTYDILVPSLLVGDLDMVLGRLPEQGRSRALVYEEFYAEPVCLVTRRGHPLTRKRRLGLRDLSNEAWLLPLPETVAAPADRARVPRGQRATAEERHRVGLDPHQPRAAAQVGLHRRDAVPRGAR